MKGRRELRIALGGPTGEFPGATSTVITLALDPALRTGFAVGAPNEVPVSGSCKMIPDNAPIEDLPAAIGFFMRDMIRKYKPDRIVREAFLAPKQMKSGDAVISQLMAHSGVLLIAGMYGIPCIDVRVETWRGCVCGRSTANPRRRGKTYKEKAADRIANKVMVRDRMALLGYVSRGETDFDRTDAVGVWEWHAITHGRIPPRVLHLFGEKAQ